MAKYSTGGSSSASAGDACELCGAESSSLREATVAGATLQVCPDCSPHDDSKQTSETGRDGETEADRTRDTVQKATDEQASLWDGDSSHWEESGTDYDDDPLPYLVNGYEEIVSDAREEAGLDVSELAVELGVDELTVLAIERGHAAQEDVAGSVVREIEDVLDVSIIDE